MLLSTDLAKCRQFTVTDGIITSVGRRAPGASMSPGFDVDHGAVTVQLMPYLDTPNNGGVYKVWVTTIEDYLLGCEALGEDDGLNVVNCGSKAGGNAHGFIPRHSKTDNFKVGDRRRGDRHALPRRSGWGDFIDGLGITWTDPLGGTNKKWSYLNEALDINHEAHVEAVENGTHLITIPAQAGCDVGEVYVDGTLLRKRGPQTVKVSSTQFKGDTIFIDVVCK